MDKSEPSEMKPKKVVKKSVVIALIIICIVLVAGLIGTIADYSSYVASHHHNDFEYNALLGTNASQLLVQVNNLTSILDLNESTVWFAYKDINQPANSYTNWTFYPPYAGYVVVDVGAASTPLTYIQVTA